MCYGHMSFCDFLFCHFPRLQCLSTVSNIPSLYFQWMLSDEAQVVLNVYLYGLTDSLFALK